MRQGKIVRVQTVETENEAETVSQRESGNRAEIEGAATESVADGEEPDSEFRGNDPNYQGYNTGPGAKQQQSTSEKHHVSNFKSNLSDQITGTSEAWLDFFVLSRATGIIASSSGFGLVAAQIGAVPFVYTTWGEACVRVDLQG